MKIPETVLECIRVLWEAGYPSYLVGGSVRDLLLDREPEDYDIATVATPEQVTALFPRVIPTGVEFGTVTVVLDRPLEVTTLRSDGAYRDGRHPSSVKFGCSVQEDLARRDFTVNAMALNPLTGTLVDPWGGRLDLSNKILRAVGEPQERFREDGLRLLRAARFVSQLGFQIEEKTLQALMQEAGRLQGVARERRGHEFSLLLVGPNVRAALELLVDTGLMASLIPELMEGKGLKQGRLHPDDVLGHNIRTCSLTPPDLKLRLAGLLHDVGKYQGWTEGPYGRYFPGHATRSAALIPEILSRLCFKKRLIRTVTLLVANHMFFWRAEMGLAPVRRLAARVGWLEFDNVITLIAADRMSIWGDPQAAGLNELYEAAAAVKKEHPPLTARELALTSGEMMSALNLTPGPAVGALRQELLEQVWENPDLNTRQELLVRARRLQSQEPSLFSGSSVLYRHEATKNDN
jgi:tRNA nucleotidyltransferase (CCA-adding enzyme)